MPLLVGSARPGPEVAGPGRASAGAAASRGGTSARSPCRWSLRAVPAPRWPLAAPAAASGAAEVHGRGVAGDLASDVADTAAAAATGGLHRTFVSLLIHTFERDVIARSRELPVVVDFWAAWCGPCRVLGPALEAEVGKRAGRLELVKIDVDAEQQIAAHYGIRSIPTVAVFRDGEAVTGFVGAVPAKAIGRFFDEQVLAEPSEQLRDAMAAQVRHKEFGFPVAIGWDGGRRTTARVDGKSPLAIATPPELRGTDPDLWSPENACVAAAGSCLAVTIAALLERARA